MTKKWFLKLNEESQYETFSQEELIKLLNDYSYINEWIREEGSRHKEGEQNENSMKIVVSQFGNFIILKFFRRGRKWEKKAP